MASNARRRGSPEAPAGQPVAGSQTAAEPSNDAGTVTGEATSPSLAVLGSSQAASGPSNDADGRGDTTNPSLAVLDDDRAAADPSINTPNIDPDGTGETTIPSLAALDDGAYPDPDRPADVADDTRPNQPTNWPTPAPMPGADGWDADSTVSWDPASVWEAEDSEGPGTSGGQWDEVPDWEGEIVRWEAEKPAQVPVRLVPGELTGVPTRPPGFQPEYLPAHQRPQGRSFDIYAGEGTPPRGVPVYDRKAGPAPKRGNAPWRELVIITAVAVIVSAVILAVSTVERPGGGGLSSLLGSPGTTSQTPTTSLFTPATTRPVAASGRSTALSSKSPKSQTASVTAGKKHPTHGAKSLPVTAGVAQSLVKSWLATNPGGYGIGPADVAGTVPHEVYYAVQPSTGTYWALAAFKPSAALLAESSTQSGQEQLAQFQDSLYAFSWQAGPVWTVLGEVGTGSCPDIWVPRAVLATWGLCGL